MTAAREKRRMDDDDDGDDPISRVRSKMSELMEELPSLNIIRRYPIWKNTLVPSSSFYYTY